MWGCISPISAASEPMVVNLTSRHRSGASAKATLKADGEATIITIAISGKGAYLPDIRSGACDDAAAVPEIPLAVGTKSEPSVTTVDVPMATLVKGTRVLMLHRADGSLSDLGPASAAACGELGPAQSTIAVGPPVTGVGPMVSQRTTQALTTGLGVAAVGLMVSAWVIRRRGERP
jgi:hypothetical protein